MFSAWHVCPSVVSQWWQELFSTHTTQRTLSWSLGLPQTIVISSLLSSFIVVEEHNRRKVTTRWKTLSCAYQCENFHTIFTLTHPVKRVGESSFVKYNDSRSYNIHQTYREQSLIFLILKIWTSPWQCSVCQIERSTGSIPRTKNEMLTNTTRSGDKPQISGRTAGKSSNLPPPPKSYAKTQTNTSTVCL